MFKHTHTHATHTYFDHLTFGLNAIIAQTLIFLKNNWSGLPLPRDATPGDNDHIRKYADFAYTHFHTNTDK